MTSHIVPTDLLEQIGMDKLPIEEQAALLEEMGDAIMSSILVRVVPMLDEASQKELETLLDTMEEPTELEVFLNSKISNFQQIVDQEVAAFRGEAGEFYKAL